MNPKIIAIYAAPLTVKATIFQVLSSTILTHKPVM